MDRVEEYILYDRNLNLLNEAVIWDEVKRMSNLEKHRIDFRDVATIFESEQYIYYEEIEGSKGKHNEIRHYFLFEDDVGIGKRVHAGVLNYRNDDIRLISVRPANRRKKQEVQKFYRERDNQMEMNEMEINEDRIHDSEYDSDWDFEPKWNGIGVPGNYQRDYFNELGRSNFRKIKQRLVKQAGRNSSGTVTYHPPR